LLHLGRAIKAKISVTMNVEELLKDVEDLRHLGEYQGAMAAGLELSQETIQSLKLTAIILQQPFVWERD